MRNQGRFLSTFEHNFLQRILQTETRPEYRRRIEIMLLADAGRSRKQICGALKCSQETVRYWSGIAQLGEAHRYRDALIGRPKTIDAAYVERLKALVQLDPRTCGYPFQRWTARWLSKHLEKEFEIEISDRHINRLLKQMGLSTRASQPESQELATDNIKIQDLQSSESLSFQWQFDLLNLNRSDAQL